MIPTLDFLLLLNSDICFNYFIVETVIFLRYNTPLHMAESIRDTLEVLSREILPRTTYSLDLAPTDYHLFASMGHAFAEQHFDTYEDVKKSLDEWFAAKGEDFYWRDIHKLPESWGKCKKSDGVYFR